MFVEVNDGVFLNVANIMKITIEEDSFDDGYYIVFEMTDINEIFPETHPYSESLHTYPVSHTQIETKKRFKTKEDAINWLKERGLL